MEHREETPLSACWRCGAPMHARQRFCLTCGANREQKPAEFGAPALQQTNGEGRGDTCCVLSSSQSSVVSSQ